MNLIHVRLIVKNVNYVESRVRALALSIWMVLLLTEGTLSGSFSAVIRWLGISMWMAQKVLETFGFGCHLCTVVKVVARRLVPWYFVLLILSVWNALRKRDFRSRMHSHSVFGWCSADQMAPSTTFVSIRSLGSSLNSEKRPSKLSRRTVSDVQKTWFKHRYVPLSLEHWISFTWKSI